MGFGRWGLRDAAGTFIKANGITMWTVSQSDYITNPALGVAGEGLTNIIDDRDSTRFNPGTTNNSCSDLSGTTSFDTSTWNNTGGGIYTFKVTFSPAVNIGAVRVRFHPSSPETHRGTRIVINSVDETGTLSNSRRASLTSPFLDRSIDTADITGGSGLFNLTTVATNTETLYVSIYKLLQFQLWLYDMSFRTS